MLFFSELWPLPDEAFMHGLKAAKMTVCIEGNATGQFASILRMNTGFKFDHQIARCDGRPFSVDYIMREIGKW